MDDCNIFDALGQVSSSEAGTIFRNFLRGSVRHLIVDVMAAKVNELCGPKHHPSDSEFVRAGSISGRVLIGARRSTDLAFGNRWLTETNARCSLKLIRPPMTGLSYPRRSFRPWSAG